MVTRVLIVDGMNFLHRARSGFTAGEHAVKYNFFRNLRALVEKIDPKQVIFVLEGTPRDRLEEFAEYKANRTEVVDDQDPKSVKKAEELQKFFKQCEAAVDLMRRAMPIQVIRHPHYECDDLIYTLCHRLAAQSGDTEIVVASNDTDFIQLLNEFKHVRLWNPHEKAYVETPVFDYVRWKSLKGDATDNIGGLDGVGPKTAVKAMQDPEVLEEILARPGNRETFERNLRLIKLKEIPQEEMGLIETSNPARRWIDVVSDFKEWGFKSIFKDKTWDKFKATFDRLE